MLFVANLNWARVYIFLFMGKGEPSQSKADDSNKDENYSYDCSGFHGDPFEIAGTFDLGSG